MLQEKVYVLFLNYLEGDSSFPDFLKMKNEIQLFASPFPIDSPEKGSDMPACGVQIDIEISLQCISNLLPS